MPFGFGHQARSVAMSDGLSNGPGWPEVNNVTGVRPYWPPAACPAACPAAVVVVSTSADMEAARAYTGGVRPVKPTGSNRWVYKSPRRAVLVNEDGEIVAEVSATRHGEWVAGGKTYIDQHSAQRAAERQHGAAES